MRINSHGSKAKLLCEKPQQIPFNDFPLQDTPFLKCYLPQHFKLWKSPTVMGVWAWVHGCVVCVYVWSMCVCTCTRLELSEALGSWNWVIFQPHEKTKNAGFLTDMVRKDFSPTKKTSKCSLPFSLYLKMVGTKLGLLGQPHEETSETDTNKSWSYHTAGRVLASLSQPGFNPSIPNGPP